MEALVIHTLTVQKKSMDSRCKGEEDMVFFWEEIGEKKIKEKFAMKT